MFELSDEIEIIGVTDIGPDANSCVIIDNFYKDPEPIRRLALHKMESEWKVKKPPVKNPQHAKDLQRNVKPIFDEICFDKNMWSGIETDYSTYEHHWKNADFMCDYIFEKDFLTEPLRILPSQDSYPLRPSMFQFNFEVFLNKPDEYLTDDNKTKGGTCLYSFLNCMTMPKPNYEKYEDIESFDDMNMALKTSIAYKVEHPVPMKYNRAILYKSQILSAPELQKSWYRENPRITQVMFM